MPRPEVRRLTGVVVGGQFRHIPPLLACGDERRDAVVIAATDKTDLIAACAPITDVGVSGEVRAGDMADVESGT